MTSITIKTRDMGPVEFYVAESGGYVYADLNDQYGTYGIQICDGGKTRGSTIRADGAGLPSVARAWNRARRRAILAEGR